MRKNVIPGAVLCARSVTSAAPASETGVLTRSGVDRYEPLARAR